MAYGVAGSGDPVILLHGIPTHSALWRNVIPHLAPRFRTYALDLLGYGDSDKPSGADLSVSAQANYLEAFMQALGIGSAHVVGHDIGAGVAQVLVVRYPSRARKLVLIDGVVDDSWPVPDIARLKEPAWDQIMETLDLAKGFRKGFARGMVHKELVTDDLVARYARPFDGLDGRRAYLRCARALDNRDLLSISDQIEKLANPTLILWGEQDDFQLPKYAGVLQRKLRNSTMKMFPDGGHFLPEDKPDEVGRATLEFLLR